MTKEKPLHRRDLAPGKARIGACDMHFKGWHEFSTLETTIRERLTKSALPFGSI